MSFAKKKVKFYSALENEFRSTDIRQIFSGQMRLV
jgi:hypothetical protein